MRSSDRVIVVLAVDAGIDELDLLQAECDRSCAFFHISAAHPSPAFFENSNMDFDLEKVIEATETYVKDFMSGNDPSHDYAHVQRVLSLAKEIERRERLHGAHLDGDVITLAALLHDVGDKKYIPPGENAKILVTCFLESIGCPTILADTVQLICSNVSYSHEIKNSEAVGRLCSAIPELAIVQDADRLDAMGAVGIARMFCYTGAKASDRGLEVSHFYEKLLKLEDMMKTETGKTKAKKRAKRMISYLGWWDEEVGEDATAWQRADIALTPASINTVKIAATTQARPSIPAMGQFSVTKTQAPRLLPPPTDMFSVFPAKPTRVCAPSLATDVAQDSKTSQASASRSVSRSVEAPHVSKPPMGLFSVTTAVRKRSRTKNVPTYEVPVEATIDTSSSSSSLSSSRSVTPPGGYPPVITDLSHFESRPRAKDQPWSCTPEEFQQYNRQRRLRVTNIALMTETTDGRTCSPRCRNCVRRNVLCRKYRPEVARVYRQGAHKAGTKCAGCRWHACKCLVDLPVKHEAKSRAGH